MSIFEYDEEGVKEVWRKECLAEGREIGREEGKEIGREEGVQLTLDVKKLYSQGKNASEIASELNAPEEEVSDIVKHLKQDNDEKDKEIERLKKELEERKL